MQNVPMTSIVGMIVSMIIAVAVPIALLIIVRKKTGARISSFFFGAGTFVVFALFLEQLLHTVVLKTGITEHIWLYAIYGGAAAAIFEECGRLFTMKLLMKNLDRENAIMYGVGHGGIEAIIILGMAEISNIATSFMINTGGAPEVFAALDDATLSQLAALWETPSYQFYLAGVERILAITLHIGLSYLVYRAVKLGHKSSFALALFIHFFVDAATVIISTKASIVIVEIMIAVIDVALILFVRKQYLADAE